MCICIFFLRFFPFSSFLSLPPSPRHPPIAIRTSFCRELFRRLSFSSSFTTNPPFCRELFRRLSFSSSFTTSPPFCRELFRVLSFSSSSFTTSHFAARGGSSSSQFLTLISKALTSDPWPPTSQACNALVVDLPPTD